VAVVRFIFKVCSRIMLKLANMKDASRKNMMSISGMISIRAFFSGQGEPIFITIVQKHQAPGKHQSSNLKLQKSTKLQTPKPTRTARLSIGAWDLKFL
jgi:hypothetical protein